MLRVEKVELTSPLAQRLIALLNEELSATYPEEGATHFRLEADEVVPGRGAFVVVRIGEQAVGCGAVRLLDVPSLAALGLHGLDGSQRCAEIKRMFVVPEARGRGYSRRLLAALEAEAAALGASHVVLETGTRQVAALSLYRGSGYKQIAPFGEYVDSPLSVCLGKAVG